MKNGTNFAQNVPFMLTPLLRRWNNVFISMEKIFFEKILNGTNLCKNVPFLYKNI
jgi:hypothetical protein